MGFFCGFFYELLEEIKSDVKDVVYVEIGMFFEGYFDIEEYFFNYINGKFWFEFWWVDCDFVEGFKDGCVWGNNGVFSVSLVLILVFLYCNLLVKVILIWIINERIYIFIVDDNMVIVFGINVISGVNLLLLEVVVNLGKGSFFYVWFVYVDVNVFGVV